MKLRYLDHDGKPVQSGVCDQKQRAVLRECILNVKALLHGGVLHDSEVFLSAASCLAPLQQEDLLAITGQPGIHATLSLMDDGKGERLTASFRSSPAGWETPWVKLELPSPAGASLDRTLQEIATAVRGYLFDRGILASTKRRGNGLYTIGFIMPA